MNRTLTYTIPAEFNNSTADGFLKSIGFSRQNIVNLKKMPQNLLINGIFSHMNSVLHTGDVLSVNISENEVSEKIPPVNLPLNIIYEDEDIIVVNKPAGMPTHPSLNNYENSLANALAYYYQTKNLAFVFRCTNRLDKDTSGLTVVAKHMVASSILSSQIKGESFQREYLAICQGIFENKEGTVCAPIGRLSDSIIERCIDYTNGESAITHYKVISQYEDNSAKDSRSLVSLVLETGRTHQIRVHMKHIGHPLLGDYLYNSSSNATVHIKRQALHSHKLSFIHPITNEKMEFTAELPQDMQSLVIAH